MDNGKGIKAMTVDEQALDWVSKETACLPSLEEMAGDYLLLLKSTTERTVFFQMLASMRAFLKQAGDESGADAIDLVVARLSRSVAIVKP